MAVNEYVNVKVLWKSVVLIVALAIFASPTAALPLLVIYGIFLLIAILLPIQFIPNTALLRMMGIALIVVGVWLYTWQLSTAAQLIGFLLLGGLAMVLPHVGSIREKVLG